MKWEQDKIAAAARLYEKFITTGQESLRLAAALEGFFLEESSDEAKKGYGEYIKRRIRPAVEALMDEEAVDKIVCLEQQGWFGETQLEGFIATARARGKMASLVWLLHLKHERYGYRDKDFEL